RCGRPRVGRLLLALSFGTNSQRLHVVKAFREMDDKRTIKGWLSALADSYSSVREAALEALRSQPADPNVDAKNATIAGGLAAALASNDEDVQRWAAEELSREKNRAALDALMGAAEREQKPAIKALRREDDPETLRLLVDRLLSSKPA